MSAKARCIVSRRVTTAAIVFYSIGCCYAFTPAAEVDYSSQIKPLLASKCYSCHGALKQEAELRLETRALMLAGNGGDPVLTPGNALSSVLFQRITADADERMPPPGEAAPLTAKEVAIIRQWIDQGASAPDEPIPSNPRDHWAFQPPIRAPVPDVNNANWSANPIDAFLAAEHARLELVPVGVAEKHILLRRVYLDLIGLPPTRAELQAFLDDTSHDAFAKVVERLLDDPAYGERWGRHWMDVWRYSDWYG